MRCRAATAPLLFGLLAATACGGGSAVARIADGHSIDGRWIPPEAYAAYLDGALLEEQGDLSSAAAAYQEALGEDPAAPEIWARLGRVRCASDPAASTKAFLRAQALGPELPDAWLSHAECALERGEIAKALASAQRAVALSPKDVDASLVIASALERAGAKEDAARWLRALSLSHPGASDMPRSPGAAIGGDAPERGTRKGVRISRASMDASRAAADASEALDQAILSGDLAAARAASAQAHLGGAGLGLRALELGQIALAREAAALSLSVEPGNTDARAAALAAADLERNEDALLRLSTCLPRDRTPLSTRAARLMDELPPRRGGAEATGPLVEAISRGARGARGGGGRGGWGGEKGGGAGGGRVASEGGGRPSG